MPPRFSDKCTEQSPARDSVILIHLLHLRVFIYRATNEEFFSPAVFAENGRIRNNYWWRQESALTGQVRRSSAIQGHLACAQQHVGYRDTYTMELLNFQTPQALGAGLEADFERASPALRASDIYAKHLGPTRDCQIECTFFLITATWISARFC
jgi:hypothetical protein